MSVRNLILIGILAALVGVILVVIFQEDDRSAVQAKIEQLAQSYDDAVYLNGDYEAAKKAANEIVTLADQSNVPNATEVRGLIRLAFLELAVGKWGNRWRKKVKRCEELVSNEPTIDRAEFLLYSGVIKGKFQAKTIKKGIEQVEEALFVSSNIHDNRTLALAYTNLGELNNFLGHRTAVAENSYRAVTIAKHHGQKSILVRAFRNLINKLVYLEKFDEAALCGKEILKIKPQAQTGLYTLFMSGESDEYLHLIERQLKVVQIKKNENSATNRDFAQIGKSLKKLAVACVVRGNLSACQKYTELAVPYLKAANDKISLRGCSELLDLVKLDQAKTVDEIDTIGDGLNRPSEMTMNAVANAYTKLGEFQQSAIWKAKADQSRIKHTASELGFLRKSAEVFWESKISSRQAELNRKRATEAQRRVWLLSTAGLTFCALLGGFYILLRRERNSLENLVEKRTQSLSTALEAASAADQAKNEFLARVNHEVRNPLTAILGYCDLLSLNKDKQLEFIAGIESSSLHLRELVDKILEVSKIESNDLELHRTEFPPAQTASGINDIVAEQAAQKGLEFDCSFHGDVTRSIVSDETKIRQIALNLIGNAIKFTEAGRVTVSFKLSKIKLSKSDALLEIVVKDSGIGIAKEETQTVFDLFSKASNGTACEGSGLGLFITKRLVECFDGEISLVSELGTGTEVTVRLPVEFACDQRASTNSQDDHDSNILEHPSSVNQTKRVVIVDDQEIIRTTLKQLLVAHGIECRTAGNLEQTMDLITNWQPDLVLLDLRMPDHSGYEVFKRIRQSVRSEVPVYAMTGDATAQVKKKCLSLGFDGFIIKPFNTKTIQEILEAKIEVR